MGHQLLTRYQPVLWSASIWPYEVRTTRTLGAMFAGVYIMRVYISRNNKETRCYNKYTLLCYWGINVVNARNRPELPTTISRKLEYI